MAIKLPKLLIFTRNFPPLVGGMEKLLFHTYLRTQPHFDVKVIGPRGCEKFAGKNSISSFPHSPVLYFLLASFFKIFIGVISIKPNLILSGSGATAPAAVLAGKCFNVPVITYLHGLDIANSNIFYRHLFLPVIRSCNGIIVNSSYTASLAHKAGIDKNKIKIIHPGTDIPKIKDFDKIRNHFRQGIKAGSRPILLSVGRLTPRKGLLEFIENCMDEIINSIPDVLLLVIGGEANDAIAPHFGLRNKINKTVVSLGLLNHVHFMGQVSDEFLRAAYISSDLLVFPILNLRNDVEGFGMVAIEAASYGLPSIAFSVGGVVDAVGHGISGLLIEEGNYQEFSKAVVNQIQDKTGLISNSSCRKFSMKFSWLKFGEKIYRTCMTYVK